MSGPDVPEFVDAEARCQAHGCGGRIRQADVRRAGWFEVRREIGDKVELLNACSAWCLARIGWELCRRP